MVDCRHHSLVVPGCRCCSAATIAKSELGAAARVAGILRARLFSSFAEAGNALIAAAATKIEGFAAPERYLQTGQLTAECACIVLTWETVVNGVWLVASRQTSAPEVIQLRQTDERGACCLRRAKAIAASVATMTSVEGSGTGAKYIC